MANAKFLDYTGLSRLVEKIKNTYAKIKHTHTKEDIESVSLNSIVADKESSTNLESVILIDNTGTDAYRCPTGKVGQVLTLVQQESETSNTSARLPQAAYSNIRWADLTIPTATSSVLGLIKIGSNITNTSGTISLTKANVTSALGYTPPTTNTDTHYTTGLKVGSTANATSNTAATNGNVYLNVLDNTTIRDSHNIVGSGATTVTSDANGKITINSTDTTYSIATTTKKGLMSALDKSKLNAIQGVDTNTLSETLDTNTYSNSMDWAPLDNTLITLGQAMNLYNKLLVPVYDAEDISDNGCYNYPDSIMRIDLQNDILEIFRIYQSTGSLTTPNMFKVCGNLFTLMGKCSWSAEEPLYRGYFYDGMQSYVPYIAYAATEDGFAYSMNFVPEEQAISLGVFDSPTPLDEKYKLKNDWG